MEENQITEKKKSNVVLVIVIVLLLLMVFGLGGFIFINRDKLFNNNSNTPVEEKTKDNTEKETNLAITSAVKERLNKFVDAGSEDDPSGSNVTATYFREGVSSISDETKAMMAFIGTKTEWKRFTEAEGNSVGINGIGPNGERIGILKISDFNATYEEFFGSKPSDSIQLLRSIVTCPMRHIPSDNSSEIYLLARCGGTSYIKYSKEITSYDSDTEYYYVHQTMTYTSPESTTEYKIVWKFDKNYMFINTTKED